MVIQIISCAPISSPEPQFRFIQVWRWIVFDTLTPFVYVSFPPQVYMKQFGDDFERGGVEWGGFFLDED